MLKKNSNNLDVSAGEDLNNINNSNLNNGINNNTNNILNDLNNPGGGGQNKVSFNISKFGKMNGHANNNNIINNNLHLNKNASA